MNQSVERYAAGAGLLRAAILGLSKSDLLAYPVPGTWSIQQIALHLVDSDLVASDRMKRVISMENPLLIGFDESAFARQLDYQGADIELACDLFEKNHQQMADVLRRLPEGAFARAAVHNERGKISLLDLVNGTSDHLDHHLEFVQQKRQLLTGKPV